MKKIFFSLFLFSFAFPAVAASVDGNYLPIFKESACTRSVSDGGLGGSCNEPICDDGTYACLWVETDGCTNSVEKPAGYCNYDSNLGEVTVCCVDKDLSQETIDAVSTNKNNLKGAYFNTTGCEEIAKGTCVAESDVSKSVGGVTSCNDGSTYVGVCKAGSDDYYCCTSDSDYLSQFGSGTPLALAQSDYTLLERLPGADTSSGDLNSYLQNLYQVGLILVVLGAVFMIAVGGFTYMASAGNTSAIKKGKGMISDAIIGLLVALFAWLILNVINPDLVNLKIDPLPQVSFEANVNIHGGSANSGTAGGSNGSGTAAPCSGELVDMPSEAQAIMSATSSKICPEAANKIKELRQKTPNIAWHVSSAIRTTGGSDCHGVGDPSTGNCFDITIDGAELHDEKYEPLCEAVMTLSGISVANEASNKPKCQQMKAYQKEDTTTGDNIHINIIQ